MVALKKIEASHVPAAYPASATPLEFTASKTALKSALAILTRVADRRSTMPMLSHVMMRATSPSVVTLVATDLNVWATVELTCHTGQTLSGGLTVSAKSLADLVKKLPGDATTIKTLASARLHAVITSGQVSATLEAMSDRDFPKVPDAGDAPFTTVSAALVSEMIEHTTFSVCKDETRFHLNGIYVECDGSTLRMTSTDGHRLTKCAKACDAPGLALKTGVIVPLKGATEIRKLLGKSKGTCEIAIVGQRVFVRFENTTLAVKCIDAQFPPYEQVIPKDHKKLVTVDRALLLAALDRASLIASDTRGVKLALATGKLTITCDSPDIGETTERIEADYNLPGMDPADDFAIGVSPKYLIDCLGEIDCKHVTIAFGGDLDPILVRGTDDQVERSLARSEFIAVVMPMRI